MMQFLLAALVHAQLGAALPPDSVDVLRRAARSAEARFERLSRSLAPSTWQTFTGSHCDEVVGRFCLRFDSTTSLPAQPEAPDVLRARREAVETVRRYFSAAPHERAAAGPLVRLLVTDGRAQEAVSAARAFAALSPDTLWGDLLLAMALHAAGADSAAERHIERGLERLDESTRREWLDLAWLLEPDERRVVERLPERDRAEYERRFWLLADPFWQSGANEYRIEHVVRHVHTRLLAEVPRVAGMERWGRDLDQLTVRYGVPTARTQAARPIGAVGHQRGSLVEHWDSAQRAFLPVRLSAGVADAPAPGERPQLYAARARAAYAYVPVSRVLEPEHQATRYLAGGRLVLRVDGRLGRSAADSALSGDFAVRPDSAVGTRAAAGDAPERPATSPVMLLAYDTSLTVLSRARGTAAWRGDTADFTMHLALPAGGGVYSVEALDVAADLGARARYAVAALPAQGPVLSDLLVAHPLPAGPVPESFDSPLLRARPSLIVARGDTLGIYAEVYRAGRAAAAAGAIAVEVALQPAGEPSLLGRLGRWIGRAIGVAGPESEPRVTWRTEVDDVVHSVALNLPLDPRLGGPQVLVLRVTDLATGRTAESTRRILIRE